MTSSNALQASASEAESVSPLKRREFRLYFIGNLASNCGTWLQNAALSVFLFNLTGSSFWVGMASTALFVPVLLLALPAGALADRTDRLQLMRRSQMAAGLLAVLLTVLVAAGLANRYVVVAIAAGTGVLWAAAIPAMQSLVPSLVPKGDLSRAIGLNSLTFNMARVIGPAVAAGALFLGAAFAFGLNALSYFVLVIALGMIGTLPFPHPRGTPGPPLEGIRYAWEHRRTRNLLISLMALSVSLDPITTLSPALVTAFGQPSGRAPLIFSAWGAGAVLGVTAGARVLKRLAASGRGWIGLPVLTAGILGLALAPSLPWAIAAGVVAGLGYINATISFTTTIQMDVPEALRGRVSALWTISFLGPRVVSSIVDGALADVVGPHLATALFALPALAVVPLARRTLRPAPAHESAAPQGVY